MNEEFCDSGFFAVGPAVGNDAARYGFIEFGDEFSGFLFRRVGI